MATITINDLATRVTLDRASMRAVRGGDGAPWVFSFQPFIASVAKASSAVVNFFQTNNIYTAEQMTIQALNVEVGPSAPGSTVNVVPTMVGLTQK
ncbi:MAG: hypothetical protein ACJ8G3_13655 [Burkholderiaceae bacterium]|jgi:hypothetical protein